MNVFYIAFFLIGLYLLIVAIEELLEHRDFGYSKGLLLVGFVITTIFGKLAFL